MLTSGVHVTHAQPALFSTAPTDHMGLFDDGVVNAKKVVHILKYKKKDVSVAANIPLTSVRYDPATMPKKLEQRLQEWAVALNLVYGFFNDFNKTVLWFSIPNPLLGGMAPRDMIRVGRFKKLHKFIQSALDENKQ